MLFGFDSGQDYADASRVIAFAESGGLGLPDRDYYTKTDAKSVETRQKYLEHVQKMLELLGEPSAQAQTHAQTIMAIETALAKASLTRVQQRDPHNLFHKMTPAQLQSLTPSFRWSDYFAAAGVAGPGRELAVVNVSEPAFYKQLEILLKSRGMDDWKTYLRWHLVNAKAPYLSSTFLTTDFDFYRKYLRGVEQQPPRWKRCVRQVDGDLGEALGQVFAAKTFGCAQRNQRSSAPWS